MPRKPKRPGKPGKQKPTKPKTPKELTDVTTTILSMAPLIVGAAFLSSTAKRLKDIERQRRDRFAKDLADVMALIIVGVACLSLAVYLVGIFNGIKGPCVTTWPGSVVVTGFVWFLIAFGLLNLGSAVYWSIRLYGAVRRGEYA